jgi:hypothetical protein
MRVLYRELYRYVFGCGSTATFILLAIVIARIPNPMWPHPYVPPLHEQPLLYLMFAIICLLVTILYPSKEVKQISGIDKKIPKFEE